MTLQNLLPPTPNGPFDWVVLVIGGACTLVTAYLVIVGRF